MLRPVGEFVVGDLKGSTSIPFLALDEFVGLLPLPKSALELEFVDVALSELRTVLLEPFKVTVVELSLHELIHLFQ